MDISADPQRHFDALFAASDDPWQFRQRWYEARKRAMTLACLPRRRYESGYEPGCANGELAAALAERCDRLLISDGAAGAVALAQQRLAGSAHVRAVQAWVPDDWPDDGFDLIAISEVGYYLSAAALGRLASKARASLQPGGDIVLCHWRRPIEGCALDGDSVHACFGEAIGLPLAWSLADPDFRLEVFSADPRSVAAREGLS